MISLVLAVISIALVVALVVLGNFYGGSKLSDAAAQADALRLRTEDQQIMAAVDIFSADHSRFPHSIHELVEGNYLRAIPRGALNATEVQAQATTLRANAGPGERPGWSVPIAGQPIILTETTVPLEVCRQYNQVSRGDNGILKQVLENLQSQCYGTSGVYRVVATKGRLAVLSTAVSPTEVLSGGIPAIDTGSVWWDIPPTTELKGVVDSEKKPFAQLALSPSSSENFGSLQLGQVAAAGERVLSNKGNIAAEGINLAVPEGFTLSSNTCSAVLSPNASCTFTVQFAPAVAKRYDTNVAISSTNGGAVALTVAGEGQTALAKLSGLNFGNLASGREVVLEAVLENRGIGPVTLAVPVVAGAGFALAPGGTCASSLPPGYFCTIKVALTGIAQSKHDGTISVTSVEAGELSAALSGQSQQAVIEVSPSRHDFGSVQLGQIKNSQRSTVRNSGNVALTGFSINAKGPFTRHESTCTGILAAGAYCELAFQFRPTNELVVAESITFSADNADSQVVELTGQGAVPAAKLMGGAFGDVAAGMSVDQLITLTNTGSGSLSVSSPTASSLTGSSFSFVDTSCTALVPAGHSCSVTLRFTANGTSAAAGTFSLDTGAGVKSVNLSGQSQQAVLAINPASYAFGNVPVAQSAVSSVLTLANTGNIPVTDLAFTPPANYALSSSNCTTGLAAGAQCTFRLSFTPSKTTAQNGSLAITGADVSGITVGLTGAGMVQSATLSSIAFGSRTAGTVTNLVSTLTNTGQASLSLTPPTASSVTGGGFSFGSTTCTSVLSPGGTCTTTVRYTASGTSAAAGTLTIYTGADAKTAALSGQSVMSVATVTSAATITLSGWYAGTSTTSAVRVRNDGNVAMTLNGSGLSGVLSVSANTCSMVSPGASCVLTVALNLANTGGTGSQAMWVSGASAGAPAVTVNWMIYTVVPRWSTVSLTFGDVAVGKTASQTIYLYNDGATTYNWASASWVANNPPNFTFNTSQCSNVSGKGGVCAVTVTFAPTAKADYGGSGIYMDGASYVGNTLRVSGRGI